MGADTSRVRPPEDWPFLAWDADTIRRFLAFVKQDDEGSFRITKWKMVEFVGTDFIQEISLIFAAFEEEDETSVSSLHLAIVLLLCNKTVPVGMKAMECLSLFDWADSGALSFYELLCLLQACAHALSRCVAVPRDPGREELERLCRDAMVAAEQSSLEALAHWATGHAAIATLLRCLSPMFKGGPALAAPAVTVAIEDVGVGEPQDFQAEGDGEGREPPEATEPPAQVETAPDAAEEEAPEPEEPPLQPLVSVRESRHIALEAYLQRVLRDLHMQTDSESARQRLHLSASNHRVVALQWRWAQAVGCSLPALGTRWTDPTACPPFSGKLAANDLRQAITDWPWVHRAYAVERARYEAVLNAKAMGSTSGGMQGARKIASDKLIMFTHEAPKTCAEDPARARSSLSEQLERLDANALVVMRDVKAADPESERTSLALQRDISRLEGAVAYLKINLAGNAEALSSDTQLLLGKTQGMLDQFREEYKSLQDKLKGARDSKSLFLGLHLARRALSVALREEHQQRPWAVFKAELGALSDDPSASPTMGEGNGSDVPSCGDLGRIAADVLDAVEPRWRRAEGARTAMLTILRGGAPRYELLLQEARQSCQGVRRVEVAAHLCNGGATGPGRPSTSRRPKLRLTVLETLAAVFDGGVGSPEDPFSSATERTLNSAAQRLSEAIRPSAAAVPSPEQDLPAESDGGGRPGSTQSGEAVDAEEGEAEAEGAEALVDAAQHSQTPVEDDTDVDVSASDVEQLREFRFKQRAARASVSVAKALLQDGFSEGILSRLESTLTESTAEVEGMERRTAFAKRRLAKCHALVSSMLDECLADVGRGMPKAEGEDTTISEASSFIQTALLSAHAEVLDDTLDVCDAPVQATIDTSFPITPQPVFASVEAGTDELDHTEVNSFGHVTRQRHKHAARIFGSLSALEFIRMVAQAAADQSSPNTESKAEAGDGGANPPSEGGAKEEEKPTHEMTLEALARCADLKAESSLLAALAEHRLISAELEMRRILEAPRHGSSSVNGSAPGQKQFSPPVRKAVSPDADVVGVSDTPVASAGDPSDVSRALAALDSAEALLVDSFQSDVERSLRNWAQEPALRARRQQAASLIQLLDTEKPHAGVAGRQGDGMVMAPPSVPAMSVWWRAEQTGRPLFLRSDEDVCPRCAQVSLLAWEGFAPVDAPPDAPRPPREVLAEHAAALRLWILAQHRLLAAEALVRGSWGSRLLAHPARCTRRLVELLWCSELGRQQVGKLAATGEACLARALDFLHPLRAEFAEFLHPADLSEFATSIRGDLADALARRARGELREHRAAAESDGMRPFLAAGLQAGIERMAACDQDSATKAQTAECAEIAAVLASGAAAPRSAAAAVERRTIECWGALRAVERLEAFQPSGSFS